MVSVFSSFQILCQSGDIFCGKLDLAARRAFQRPDRGDNDYGRRFDLGCSF